MKIIAQYTSRVTAEEDHNYLMSRGVASVIHGDAAPQCLTEYFGSEPISLAVQNELSEHAKELLYNKRNNDPIVGLRKWITGQTKTRSSGR